MYGATIYVVNLISRFVTNGRFSHSGSHIDYEVCILFLTGESVYIAWYIRYPCCTAMLFNVLFLNIDLSYVPVLHDRAISVVLIMHAVKLIVMISFSRNIEQIS